MKKLSLFSGIGGIDLAAEWAGMETVAFCEREPFPQKVLRKHWPNVPIYDDVCTLSREVLERDGIISASRTIDVVSAGFPCQPFSVAGKRDGTEDERYLCPEVVRVLQEIKPTWFIGENVPGIISMANAVGSPQVEGRTILHGEEEDIYEAIYTQQEEMLFGRICKDLEDIGYEVQVFIIPAAATSAAHKRDRVIILGNAERSRCGGVSWRRTKSQLTNGHCKLEDVANATGEGFSQRRQSGLTSTGTETESRMEPEPKRCSEALADTQSIGRDYGDDGENKRQTNREIDALADTSSYSIKAMADTSSPGRKKCHSTSITNRTGHSSRSAIKRGSEWTAQSGMGGMPNEFSYWMDGRGLNPLDALVKWIQEYPQPALMGQPQYDWEPPRVANGVKDRVGRLRALGNAVNPVQVYPILYAIKRIDDYMGKDGRA